jgi:hypothetical protein
LANLGQTQFGIGQAGFNQNLANQQQGLGQSQAQQQALLASLGAFGGAQGQSFGQDQAQQQALANERAYQNGIAQQTLGNQVTQQQLQAQLQNQLFNQQLANQGLALQGSQAYGQQAQSAFGGVGDLLGQMGQQQGYATPTDYTSYLNGGGQQTVAPSPFQFQLPAPAGTQWSNGQLIPVQQGF